MFSRKRSELSPLIERAARLDLYERIDLEEYISRAILEYVYRSKAKKISDIVERVRPVCDAASYLGRVCTTCYLIEKVADEAEDYGLNLEEYRAAIRSTAQVLDVLFQNAEDRYISVVSEAIPRDSTLLVVSYSARMEKMIPALMYKFERVYIPVRDPMRTGVKMAETLKNKGVEAAYIPDHSLAWAVKEADVVLADAIGLAPGERLIVDAGVAPAVALSDSRGAKPIIVLPLPASCQRRTLDESRLPTIIIESTLGGPRVKLSLVDLLDPKTYRFSVATENTVFEASRVSIRDRARVAQEIVDDTIQSTLDSMI